MFPSHDLTSQVGLFLTDFAGSAPSQATYVIFIGANDVRDALAAFQSDPSGTTSFIIMGAALQTVVDNISALLAAGAQRFLIANMPDLAITPAVRELGPQAQFLGNFLSATYNAQLETVIQALEATPGTQFLRLNVFEILSQAAADPDSIGISNAIDPCLTFGATRNATCQNPRDHLFWDAAHPTSSGHALLAREALQIVSQ